MKIQIQTATVYYSPTRRRRFFTKQGAASAEARALIYQKYPIEQGDDCSTGYVMKSDSLEEYQKLYSRLTKLIKMQIGRDERPVAKVTDDLKCGDCGNFTACDPVTNDPGDHCIHCGTKLDWGKK